MNSLKVQTDVLILHMIVTATVMVTAIQNYSRSHVRRKNVSIFSISFIFKPIVTQPRDSKNKKRYRHITRLDKRIELFTSNAVLHPNNLARARAQIQHVAFAIANDIISIIN